MCRDEANTLSGEAVVLFGKHNIKVSLRTQVPRDIGLRGWRPRILENTRGDLLAGF